MTVYEPFLAVAVPSDISIALQCPANIRVTLLFATCSSLCSEDDLEDGFARQFKVGYLLSLRLCLS